MTRSARPAALLGALAGTLVLALPAAITMPAVAAEPSAAAPSLLPVWATFGAERPVVGGTVRLREADGTIVATARTNANGRADFDGAIVPERFLVSVSGGTVAGQPNDATLVTVDRRSTGPIEVTYVNPVSTVAAAVAKATGSSFDTAHAKVLRAAGLPSWMSPWELTAVSGGFDTRAFAGFARQQGGARVAIAEAAQRIAAGDAVPDLDAMEGPARVSGRAGTLEGRSEEVALGEELMISIVGGLASGTASATIGSLMGIDDPTYDEISSVASAVDAINTALLQLKSDLIVAQTQSTLNQVEQTMLPATSQTVTQWQGYQAWLAKAETEDPTSSAYAATAQQYASNFQQYLQGEVALYQDMFSTPGSEGLLQALYAAQAASNPWWNESDITALQSTIDYYGTLQAQATALLSESWQLPGWSGTKTPDYVDSEVNGVLSPQNADIYLSYPQDIPAGQVYIPSTQRMYQLSPFTTPNLVVHQELTNGATTTVKNAPTSCSSDTEEAPNGWGIYTPDTVSASTAQGWWASVVPAGNTISGTDAFGILSKPKANKSTSLQSLQPSAPGAKVMVTASSSNSVSLNTGTSTTYIMGIPDTVPTKPTSFYGWMWCWNATVSMASSSDIAGWKLNPAWTGSNKSAFAPTYQWPVGVLSYRSVAIGYVPPSS